MKPLQDVRLTKVNDGYELEIGEKTTHWLKTAGKTAAFVSLAALLIGGYKLFIFVIIVAIGMYVSGAKFQIKTNADAREDDHPE